MSDIEGSAYRPFGLDELQPADAPASKRRRGRAERDVNPYVAPPVAGSAVGASRASRLTAQGPFRTGFLFVLGGLLAFGLVGVLATLQQLIVLVVLSLFLALGINPIVMWVVRRGVSRPVAVPLVAIGILAVLAGGAWAVLPVIQDQLVRIVSNAPGYLEGLRENPQIASLDQQLHLIDKVTEQVKSGTWMNALFGGIVGAGKVLANTVFSFIMTLVLTLYFLASLNQVKGLIYQLAPASKRDRVRYLANEMFSRIGGYLSGMFIDVSLWALGAFILCNLIGLGQYAFALAFVVWAFAFIPVVGSFISMGIVSIIAFSISPSAGVICLVCFLSYSQLDAYIIQPRIFSQSLKIPPALVVLGALAGGLLLGIVGALLAIPTVASLILLYREVAVPHLDSV